MLTVNLKKIFKHHTIFESYIFCFHIRTPPYPYPRRENIKVKIELVKGDNRSKPEDFLYIPLQQKGIDITINIRYVWEWIVVLQRSVLKITIVCSQF